MVIGEGIIYLFSSFSIAIFSLLVGVGGREDYNVCLKVILGNYDFVGS